MTPDQMKRFVDGLHQYLERAFAPLVQRIKALESGPVAGKASSEVIGELRADLARRDARMDMLERRIQQLHEDVNGDLGGDNTLRMVRLHAAAERANRDEP